jgi:hypothetical protein
VDQRGLSGADVWPVEAKGVEPEDAGRWASSNRQVPTASIGGISMESTHGFYGIRGQESTCGVSQITMRPYYIFEIRGGCFRTLDKVR